MKIEVKEYNIRDIDWVPSTFEEFAREICNYCKANDWFCPSYCAMLEKASKMDYEIIRKKYIQHEGDHAKICRYIKNTKKIKIK